MRLRMSWKNQSRDIQPSKAAMTSAKKKGYVSPFYYIVRIPHESVSEKSAPFQVLVNHLKSLVGGPSERVVENREHNFTFQKPVSAGGSERIGKCFPCICRTNGNFDGVLV